MSDATQVILIAMLGATMASGIAAWVTVRTAAQKAAADSAKKDAALEQIHILVNSRLTEALTEIAALRKEIAAASPHDPKKAQAAADANERIGGAS